MSGDPHIEASIPNPDSERASVVATLQMLQSGQLDKISQAGIDGIIHALSKSGFLTSEDVATLHPAQPESVTPIPSVPEPVVQPDEAESRQQHLLEQIRDTSSAALVYGRSAILEPTNFSEARSNEEKSEHVRRGQYVIEQVPYNNSGPSAGTFHEFYADRRAEAVLKKTLFVSRYPLGDRVFLFMYQYQNTNVMDSRSFCTPFDMNFTLPRTVYQQLIEDAAQNPAIWREAMLSILPPTYRQTLSEPNTVIVAHEQTNFTGSPEFLRINPQSAQFSVAESGIGSNCGFDVIKIP